jgi:tryptophan synthase beta chain
MAAKFGYSCTIYMGEVDVARQRPNVFWMEQLGATVVPVRDGARILKDAINEALRDWSTNMDTTHYVLGTACGPHPYPEMVSFFQSIVGQEVREQILRQSGRAPTRVYACVGGGSNALGIFSGFIDNSEVELVGVEAGGQGLETRKHAARLASEHGSVGVAQGYKTYFLQDDDGQMLETHSVAAGLDYIGVSPILSAYHEEGRIRFEAATDEEVLEATRLLMRKEGIISALESAHALAGAFREATEMNGDEVVVINLSGRGDKDIFTIADALGDTTWKSFITTKAEEYRA